MYNLIYDVCKFVGLLLIASCILIFLMMLHTNQICIMKCDSFDAIYEMALMQNLWYDALFHVIVYDYVWMHMLWMCNFYYAYDVMFMVHDVMWFMNYDLIPYIIQCMINIMNAMQWMIYFSFLGFFYMICHEMDAFPFFISMQCDMIW